MVPARISHRYARLNYSETDHHLPSPTRLSARGNGSAIVASQYPRQTIRTADATPLPPSDPSQPQGASQAPAIGSCDASCHAAVRAPGEDHRWEANVGHSSIFTRPTISSALAPPGRTIRASPSARPEEFWPKAARILGNCVTMIVLVPYAASRRPSPVAKPFDPYRWPACLSTVTQFNRRRRSGRWARRTVSRAR